MIKQRTQCIVKLNPADVKDFVLAASKCDFDVDIAYGSVVVDAKSILGILGMDLRKNLTVSYYGENENFESFLNTIRVAA